MKKILSLLLLISVLPLFFSCEENDLAETEWVNVEGEQTLSFKTGVGGYYNYIAYAGITGERSQCASEFTYRYDGESVGEMHIRNYVSGCIISSPVWTFTVLGGELYLKEGAQDIVFVRK